MVCWSKAKISPWKDMAKQKCLVLVSLKQREGRVLERKGQEIRHGSQAHTSMIHSSMLRSVRQVSPCWISKPVKATCHLHTSLGVKLAQGVLLLFENRIFEEHIPIFFSTFQEDVSQLVITNKIPGTNNLKEERSTLSHDFRGFSPSFTVHAGSRPELRQRHSREAWYRGKCLTF